MIGVMAIPIAAFSCYVRDCDEPMARMTTPLIGPCKNHTDEDVWATLAWMREQLSALRTSVPTGAGMVPDS
jgi:hypothetical protein